MLQNDFSYCPSCGVQCRDLQVDEPAFTQPNIDESGARTFKAIYRLEEMVSTLKSIEKELNIFLATRQG